MSPGAPAAPPLTATRITLVCVAIAVATFLPALTTRYGFSDDYSMLFASFDTPAENARFMLSMGRPLTAAIHYLGFRFIRDIDALVYFRAIGVVGAGLAAAILVRTAERWEYRRAYAWVAGLGLLALPSTVVAVSWAILCQGSLALALGLLAGTLLSRPLDQASSPSASRLWALPILVAATLLYQPGAMGFWLILVLVLLSPAAARLDQRQWLRLTRDFFIVGGLAGVVGLATQQLGIAWTGYVGTRAHLAGNLAAKATNLLTQAWPRVFDPWSRTTHELAASLGALVVLLGVLFAAQVPPWQRPARAALVMAAFPLCYLPSVVSAEDFPAFRTMLGLMPLLPILLAALLEGLTTRLGRGPKHLSWGAGATLVAALAWSHVMLRSYVTEPQREELRRARLAVALVPATGPVLLRAARKSDSLAPDVCFDELGYPSTAITWVPRPFFQLLHREQHGGWREDVTILDGRSPLPSPPAIVIDFGRMLKAPR